MTRLRQLQTVGREMLVTTTLATDGSSAPPVVWGWMARQFSGQGSIEDDDRAAIEAAQKRAHTPYRKPKPVQAVRGPW